MILSVGEKIYMIILYPILARVEMVFPNFLKFFWQNEKSRRPAGAAAMRCSLLGRNCGLNLRDNRGAVQDIRVLRRHKQNFTGHRIDALLLNLRKAGVPKIALKAVITEQNSRWTFYQLYEEIKKEHLAMTAAETEKEKG